jgi:xanthine dehydrogenase YagT iron-sulfur-binding subunit
MHRDERVILSTAPTTLLLKTATGTMSLTLPKVRDAAQARALALAVPGLDLRRVVDVTLSIDGEIHSLIVHPRITLLDVLREHLHRGSPNYVCGPDFCLDCIVLADGAAVASCSASAEHYNGSTIVTVGDLSKTDTTPRRMERTAQVARITQNDGQPVALR